MGLELEFKYALTGPGQLEELLQELEKAFGPWEAVEMETVYYDTPDQALAARHWTLRVRQENGRPVLTVKTPGPGRARGEWELPGGGLADLSKLQTLGAPWEVTSLQPDQLLPRCGARFRRLRLLACLPDAVAELALDQGVLTGGGRDLPFWELEAERKGGSGEALAQWCRSLSEAWHLQEETRSKFARAASLIKT
ncbi:MAG: hypothetical protein BHW33_05910 [Firmicutes bacterium CAG:137_57_8]|nr:MAG: hypothetical protein BHW33_05910 [Firmicutes bacterium CAG:137_57_8]